MFSGSPSPSFQPVYSLTPEDDLLQQLIEVARKKYNLPQDPFDKAYEGNNPDLMKKIHFSDGCGIYFMNSKEGKKQPTDYLHLRLYEENDIWGYYDAKSERQELPSDLRATVSSIFQTGSLDFNSEVINQLEILRHIKLANDVKNGQAVPISKERKALIEKAEACRDLLKGLNEASVTCESFRSWKHSDYHELRDDLYTAWNANQIKGTNIVASASPTSTMEFEALVSGVVYQDEKRLIQHVVTLGLPLCRLGPEGNKSQSHGDIVRYEHKGFIETVIDLAETSIDLRSNYRKEALYQLCKISEPMLVHSHSNIAGDAAGHFILMREIFNNYTHVFDHNDANIIEQRAHEILDRIRESRPSLVRNAAEYVNAIRNARILHTYALERRYIEASDFEKKQQAAEHVLKKIDNMILRYDSALHSCSIFGSFTRETKRKKFNFWTDLKTQVQEAQEKGSKTTIEKHIDDCFKNHDSKIITSGYFSHETKDLLEELKRPVCNM